MSARKGEIDMILGQLATDQDFEELVTDLWLASEDAVAFPARMQALGDQLLAAKLAYLEAKALDDRLLGDALAAGARSVKVSAGGRGFLKALLRARTTRWLTSLGL